MIAALSAVSCFGFASIFALCFTLPKIGKGAYWPPPSAGSWQHHSFRALFRLGLYPLVLLSAMLLRDAGSSNAAIGLPLLILGFGAALWITRAMGWGQAFGEAQTLITTGAFAYSRNPVYVATWAALIGWAICLPYVFVILPLALWALLYAVAPFFEEPWLEQHFGDAYRLYKTQVPRFFFGL